MNRIIGWLFLFAASTLSAQATNNNQVSIFRVDAMTRGTDLCNLITNFLATNPKSVSEAMLQTANLNYNYTAFTVNQQLIPFIQSISPGPYDTMFLVRYSPNRSGTPQYMVAVPIEQIVEVILSITPNITQTGVINNTANAYTATYTTNIIPLLSINPTQRAADIQYVVSNLAAYAPTSTTQNNYAIAIQTGVNGFTTSPFYPNNVKNGLFTNVLSATQVNNSFVQINYYFSGVTGSFTLPAEQIQQIFLYPKGLIL